MTKKELIEKVLNSMRDDVCAYEDLLFELAETGLKKWTIDDLKSFLGTEYDFKGTFCGGD